jgi:hypothetical protein
MSDQGNVQMQEAQQEQMTNAPTPQPVRAFNPNEHLIQLKSGQTSKEYLPVQWRLVWFRALCPEGTIETEMLHLDLDRETEEESWAWNAQTRRNEKIVKRANGFVVFKATVRDGRGGMATGTKSEKAASFPDFIEKAETGAIGRALAALGYGTQFAPELDEAHRIVDAPVERYTPAVSGTPMNGSSNSVSAPAASASTSNAQSGQQGQAGAASMQATEQQLASIRKLSEHLGKNEPEEVARMSYLDAKKLIQQLTAEYREQRQKAS